MRLTRHTTIRRPVEDVFDFVADTRNDPQWAPLVDSVEQVEGDGPCVGAVYRVHQWVRPRHYLWTALRMTTYDRPKKLAWVGPSPLMNYECSMVFEEDGDGTRITQSNVEEWSGPWSWVGPIARPLVTITMWRQFRRLRKILEDPSRTPSGSSSTESSA